MNGAIWKRLIDIEQSSKSIEQWSERITNLDRYWKKSGQKEEKLRKRRELENQTSKTNILANTRETNK